MKNNLKLISFVGIDQNIDFNNLLLFKNSNTKYEFSVLYSENKNNIRYPDYNFCSSFLKWTHENDMLGSLHLCGSSILKYLDEDQEIIDLCNISNRIQLNLNIINFDDHKKLSNNILKVAENNKHSIILQENKSKLLFNEIFMGQLHDFNIQLKYKSYVYSSLSLLHDSSGGNGKEISYVCPPSNKYFTGYAGGISPDNVENLVSLIDNYNINNYDYYIDMESGVREDNNFSIKKCLLIKNIIENIIK